MEFTGDFDQAFKFLTEDVKLEPERAAYALAQANAYGGVATWYESSDFPVREIRKLGMLVSGLYRIVL